MDTDGEPESAPTSSYHHMNDGNEPASLEIPDVSAGMSMNSRTSSFRHDAHSRSSSFRHDSVGLQTSSVSQKTSVSFDSTYSGRDPEGFEGTTEKKKFRFARNSDLESVMSFDRVTMSAGRLSELWHPDPHSRNQWVIPEIDIENKNVVVLHSWCVLYVLGYLLSFFECVHRCL
jgi:hypothetical protein